MNENTAADYAYNRVPYLSHAVPHTHPDHMAALGKLFGMHPPDIRHCRVLELGCGDGGNLIPMAYGLPDSRFTGIDLSGRAISEGQTLAGRVGLKNLDLISCDILDIGDDIGPFDFIIAHGVFSWVPDAVREKMLAICRHSLTEQGIVFISYNTYPGAHLNRIANEAMRFHTASAPSPEQKNMQALGILKFLAEASVDGEIYGDVLKDQLKGLSKIRPEAISNHLFHDRLSEMNHPFYFTEFMGMAQQSGLRFLAEADYSEMQDFFLKPEIANILQKLAGNSIIAKEQYLDFIKGRKFRKTLLCRESISLDRRIHPINMKKFFFSGHLRCMDAEDKPLPTGAETAVAVLLRLEGLRFRAEQEDAVLVVDRLLPRLALFHLSRIWPRRMSFEEMITLGRKYGLEMNDDEVSALCEVLHSGCSVNMIRLHVWSPRIIPEASTFPVASEVVRQQIAQRQKQVTGLIHQTIELEDTYGLVLLPLMDGTREMDSLRDEALKIIREQQIPLKGKTPDQKTDERLCSEIDEEIANCAKYALLLA